jgi:hypothetical protein
MPDLPQNTKQWLVDMNNSIYWILDLIAWEHIGIRFHSPDSFRKRKFTVNMFLKSD